MKKHSSFYTAAIMSALAGIDTTPYPNILTTGTTTGRLSGRGTKLHNTSREQERRMRQQAKKQTK